MKKLLLPIGLLVLGVWMAWNGVAEIIHAKKHKGSGVVAYEYHDKLEGEAQYKRHHQTYGIFGVAMGLLSIGLGVYGFRNSGRSSPTTTIAKVS